MLIDDGEDFTNLLKKEIFKCANYKLVLAGNCSHACQKIKFHSDINLLICGIKVDELSVEEFLRKTRVDLCLKVPTFIIATEEKVSAIQEVNVVEEMDFVLFPHSLSQAMMKIDHFLQFQSESFSVA